MDHPFASPPANMLPDDAPIRTGVKSKPRQRGD
jgi:hypothetical protein